VPQLDLSDAERAGLDIDRELLLPAGEVLQLWARPEGGSTQMRLLATITSGWCYYELDDDDFDRIYVVQDDTAGATLDALRQCDYLYTCGTIFTYGRRKPRRTGGNRVWLFYVEADDEAPSLPLGDGGDGGLFPLILPATVT
jgi:hypothetical protein